jgi:hypothetical protein
MKIAEFFVEILVKADTDKLGDFKQGVNDVGVALGKASALITATAVALDQFTKGTVDGVVALQNMNNQTGLMIEKMQQLQAAGQLANLALTAEQVSSSVANLQANLTQIALGGGNVAGFQLLGISVAGKDAFQVIEDLRSAIVGLDEATATNLIQQTGLDAGFINILRMTNEEFSQLSDGLTFLDPQERRALLEFGQRVQRIRIEMGLFKDRAVVALLPFINKLVEAFKDISWLFEMIGKGLKILSDRFEILKTIAIAVGVALATVFAPFTTAVAGVLLALDDLSNYLQGNGSVIGLWIEDITNLFNGLGKQIDKVIGKFRDVRKFFGDKIDAVKEFGSGVVGSLGLSGGTNNQNATFNNTYNINSNADGRDVARNVTEQQQRQFDFSFDEFNNGSVI